MNDQRLSGRRRDRFQAALIAAIAEGVLDRRNDPVGRRSLEVAQPSVSNPISPAIDAPAAPMAAASSGEMATPKAVRIHTIPRQEDGSRSRPQI